MEERDAVKQTMSPGAYICPYVKLRLLPFVCIRLHLLHFVCVLLLIGYGESR
jgi:hypothetical protein